MCGDQGSDGQNEPEGLSRCVATRNMVEDYYIKHLEVEKLSICAIGSGSRLPNSLIDGFQSESQSRLDATLMLACSIHQLISTRFLA